VVGGATSVLALSRARAAALAVAAAALVAYVAAAENLWDLPSSADAAVVALLVLPAFTSLIWLALPVWRSPFPYLLFGGLLLVVCWIALDALGLDALANVVKLASFATLGFWLLSLFDELWWVALVALLIPWVDAWSVATGPTRYVTQEQPGFFEHVSVAFPLTGEPGSINMGPPDVVFFALFLAAADRFRLRVAWTWIGMTGLLALTVALVWWLADSGLPALPAVAFGFLLPNADRIWRHAKDARAAARARSASD
jgi:hypothetical protein